MDNLMLPQANNSNAAIELKVLDNNGKEKNLLFYFNISEGWNDIDESNICDLMGFFAGGLMQMVGRDKTVLGYEAKGYRVQDGQLVKSFCYTPYVKHMGEFKSAIISNDGTIELL